MKCFFKKTRIFKIKIKKINLAKFFGSNFTLSALFLLHKTFIAVYQKDTKATSKLVSTCVQNESKICITKQKRYLTIFVDKTKNVYVLVIKKSKFEKNKILSF